MARGDVRSSPSSSTVPKDGSARQSATFAASGCGRAAEKTPSPSSAATASPWAVGADQYRHTNRSLRPEAGQMQHTDLRPLPLPGFAGEKSPQAAYVVGDLPPRHRPLAQSQPAGKT
jgi:hypothetical protein